MSAAHFEALAERQISAPIRARTRAVAKRAQTAAEKRLEERDLLMSLYRQGRRQEIDSLLAGPAGKDVRGLVSFMRTMTLSSATALVRLIESAAWIRELSAADRGLVESLVFNGISRLRERNGLSFWDDSVDGTPRAFDDILAAMRAPS